MRIGYCIWKDPNDKKSWSGLPYYIMKALERHCGEVIPLGPLNNKLFTIGKIVNKCSSLFLRKKFDYYHSIPIAKEFATNLQKKLKGNHFDLLFFPAGCEILSFLETEIKKVYFSDTTFNLMVDYYPNYSNLLNISKKWGNLLEKRALKKADIILYPSQWAAKSAVKDYNVENEKIFVIPCGINVDKMPSMEEIYTFRNENKAILKLLFVGIDWDRKGGDIALQTMIELNKRGVDTELTIVGVKQKLNFEHPKLKIIGFLDKNNLGQTKQLESLYLESSFFFLPTRNECFGLVFAEAAAYGLPVVATDTGGVSYYVENNVTGALLPLEADYKAYADKIQEIWLNKPFYSELCRNAKHKSILLLNWDSWGKSVKEILNKKLNRN